MEPIIWWPRFLFLVFVNTRKGATVFIAFLRHLAGGDVFAQRRLDFELFLSVLCIAKSERCRFWISSNVTIDAVRALAVPKDTGCIDVEPLGFQKSCKDSFETEN